MRLTAAIWSVLICLVFTGPTAGQSVAGSDRGKPSFWVVPHTHWEGAVFKTREEYLEMGLSNILKALYLLQKYPDYRFVLDQVAYVRPFLERYPEEQANFRKFVAEGRLQLVGGMDIMPDVNMPSGESFVRQLLYGKGYYRDELGVDVTVGWLLDTFGHHAQIPQILSRAGFKSFWFFRGVPSLDTPSEFLWEGIDGSRIPAFWLPYGYGLLHSPPANILQFEAFMRGRFASLDRFSKGFDRVGLAGADVSEPEEHFPLLVEAFNRKADRSFDIRFAVPTDFEAAVAKRADRPVIKGEFNPLFQGVYSSRIDIKQRMRNLERLLTTVEKLSVLSNWLGAQFQPDQIWRAWEPVLFNQTHDLASGVMVDKVYEDSLRGFEFSQRLADEMIESRLEFISSKMDTRGAGIPIVVFNTLGWPRTDITEITLGFTSGSAHTLRLLDPEGKPVPLEIVQLQRYGDDSIKESKIAFVARNIPALGYALYHILPEAPNQQEAAGQYGIGWSRATAQQDSDSIENDFYRVTFDLWTGAMTSLLLKDGNWEALSAPANVVAREYDGGDFWELYGTLNGARNIAMKQQHPVPGPDRAAFSNQQVGGSGRVRIGPVISEYSVSHPFGSGNFATSVRVYPGVRRIDVRTRILNNERFVRYRALFPTSVRNGISVHEIPFGAIERPAGQEFPAQNWVDYGNGQKGIALLNRGIPGNNVADGTLMLSLLRSTRIEAYAFHGGYEPGVSSDSGLELGKEVTLNYALIPHSGDWREARIYREGMELNHPLISRKTGVHEGTLPKRWGLLEVSDRSVVLSALKPGKSGEAVLRVYEATGRPAAGVELAVNVPVKTAHEATLMEDLESRLALQGNSIRFDLAPYQIKTLVLTLQPQP